jgi:hypothetical protein
LTELEPKMLFKLTAESKLAVTPRALANTRHE